VTRQVRTNAAVPAGERTSIGGKKASSAKGDRRLLAAVGDLGRPVLAHRQLGQLGRLLDDEPLFVGQVQQADEAVRGADVVHDRLGVDALQAVHHVGELERRVVGAASEAGCLIVVLVRCRGGEPVRRRCLWLVSRLPLRLQAGFGGR